MTPPRAPLRILAFTTLLPNPAEPGKGTFVVARLDAAARASGAEVEAISPIPYYPPIPGPDRWRRFRRVPREGQAARISVRYPRVLVTPKLGTSLYATFMAAGARSEVLRTRSRFPFSVLDAHYLYPDGAAAAILARSLRVPLVLSARGSDLHSLRRKPLLRPWLRFAIRRATRLIVVSKSLLSDVEALGIDPAIAAVIPNGVDAARFKPLDRARARERLSIPAGDRIVLAVGRLHPVKDLPLLFAAFHRALRDLGGKGAALYVVGSGAEEPKLRGLAERDGLADRIRLVGERPQDELPEWYSAADVFCLSSVREGCPNALLEALACGTPAVSTDVGDVRDVIVSPAIGLVVSGRDPEALGSAIRQALSRDFDREAVALAVRGRSWEAVGEAVASEWRRAASEFDASRGVQTGLAS